MLAGPGTDNTDVTEHSTATGVRFKTNWEQGELMDENGDVTNISFKL